VTDRFMFREGGRRKKGRRKKKKKKKKKTKKKPHKEKKKRKKEEREKKTKKKVFKKNVVLLLSFSPIGGKKSWQFATTHGEKRELLLVLLATLGSFILLLRWKEKAVFVLASRQSQNIEFFEGEGGHVALALREKKFVWYAGKNQRAQHWKISRHQLKKKKRGKGNKFPFGIRLLRRGDGRGNRQSHHHCEREKNKNILWAQKKKRAFFLFSKREKGREGMGLGGGGGFGGRDSGSQKCNIFIIIIN